MELGLIYLAEHGDKGPALIHLWYYLKEIFSVSVSPEQIRRERIVQDSSGDFREYLYSPDSMLPSRDCWVLLSMLLFL